MGGMEGQMLFVWWQFGWQLINANSISKIHPIPSWCIWYRQYRVEKNTRKLVRYIIPLLSAYRVWVYIDGLVQDCSNSSALTLQLLQSCTWHRYMRQWVNAYYCMISYQYCLGCVYSMFTADSTLDLSRESKPGRRIDTVHVPSGPEEMQLS